MSKTKRQCSSLGSDALDLATHASQVTLSARKLLDDVMRVIGA